MFNFDFIKKAMNGRDFVETISVIEQTLQKDPGRIIFRSRDCWVRLRTGCFHGTEPRSPVDIARGALSGSDGSPRLGNLIASVCEAG
jgi:hypothetical protein